MICLACMRGTNRLCRPEVPMARSQLLAMALAFAAAVSPSRAEEARQVRIVKQPGLAYLPLIVMRELRMIEKSVPGVQVEWRRLASGPVIREWLVVGDVD